MLALTDVSEEDAKDVEDEEGDHRQEHGDGVDGGGDGGGDDGDDERQRGQWQLLFDQRWRNQHGNRRLLLGEPVLVAAGLAAYLGVIFFFLGPWHGALFIAVHRALGGIYMGSVFAPNHKGMPILDSETEMDYLHMQTLTARNVQGSPLADFWYGGLNYQIEHHLFPNMPRNNLKKAQVIVVVFAAADCRL